MPRNARINQELREVAQERILGSALMLFARDGYEKTTVQMIAKEAHMAQGLLYHYFESKQALLRAIFERSMRDVRASFTLSQDAATPQQRIERLLRHSFAILQEHRIFWRLSYSVRMQTAVMEGLGDALSDWVQEIQATLLQYFEQMEASHPATKAVVLFALIDGIAQQYVINPEQYPLDAVIAEVVSLFALRSTAIAEN